MESKWNSYPIQGWGGFILKEKLKKLKKDLIIWKEKIFGNLDTSIEKQTAESEKLDILDNAFGLEPSETEDRAAIMSDIMQKFSWKEAQLFQKARIKWVLEENLNSRFFHKWINSRMKINSIDGIWSNGSWIDSVSHVKAAIYNHFKSHFASPPKNRPRLGPTLFTRRLGEAENAFLSCALIEDEN